MKIIMLLQKKFKYKERIGAKGADIRLVGVSLRLGDEG